MLHADLTNPLVAPATGGAAAAPALAGRRLVFVDGLRGVAASMVVASHFVGRLESEMPVAPALSWTAASGALGVAIFFVLSGFVIALSIGAGPITASFAGRFALRRAIRLDPPYWVSLAAAILLAALAARMFGIAKTFPASDDVIAHLFYLQNLLGYGDIVAVYWTLCLEVQFYLFLLVLLWAAQRVYRASDSSAVIDRSLSRVLLLALLVLSLGELTAAWDVTPAGTFMPYWFCFGLGAMTYWVLAGWMSRRTLGLGAGIVLATGMALGNPWCVTAAATATLLYVAGRRQALTTWLSGPIMQFLGRISYSLYLFHAIAGWSAMSVALRYLPRPLHPVHAAIAVLVGAAASVGSAWAMYWLVERRSIEISRLVTLQPRTAGTAAVREYAPATGA